MASNNKKANNERKRKSSSVSLTSSSSLISNKYSNIEINEEAAHRKRTPSLRENASQNVNENNSQISMSSDSIVLDALRKLKEYCWGPPRTDKQLRPNGRDRLQEEYKDEREEKTNKNVMNPMRPIPEKYTSKNQEILQKKKEITDAITIDDDRNENKIISAVFEFAVARGILGKAGKYFWFAKDTTARSVTPGIALMLKTEDSDSANDAEEAKQIQIDIESLQKLKKSQNVQSEQTNAKKRKKGKSSKCPSNSPEVNAKPAPKKQKVSYDDKKKSKIKPKMKQELSSNNSSESSSSDDSKVEGAITKKCNCKRCRSN